MTPNLETKRRDVHAKLAGLQAQRGASLLDGKKFDDAEVSALQDELVALEDAAAEQTRRDRKAAEDEFRTHRASIRKRLTDTERDRLNSWEQAESHLRAYAKEVEKLRRIHAVAADLARQLGGAVPLGLAAMSVDTRIANRISAIMGEIPGCRYRLGHINWHPGTTRAQQRWADEEDKLLGRALNELLKDTTIKRTP